jgi:choice-of-anchor C domain-containing protein
MGNDGDFLSTQGAIDNSEPLLRVRPESGGDLGSSGQSIALDVPLWIDVPLGADLATAEFTRSGPDLIIRPLGATSPDSTSSGLASSDVSGQTSTGLLVEGYFGFEVPPALVGQEGISLPGRVVETLAGGPPARFAQAGPNVTVADAGEIGKVVVVTGTVTLQRADGSTILAEVGTIVLQNDVVITDAGSEVGITFTDGSVFNLSENGRMTLDEYIYNPDGGEANMLVGLLQGTLAVVSGQIAPTGNMEVSTPVATLGIRGTSVVINLAGSDLRVALVTDVKDGQGGLVQVIDNASGNVLQELSVGQIGQLFELAADTGLSQLTDLTPAEQQVVQSAVNTLVQNYSTAQQNPIVPQGGNQQPDGGQDNGDPEGDTGQNPEQGEQQGQAGDEPQGGQQEGQQEGEGEGQQGGEPEQDAQPEPGEQQGQNGEAPEHQGEQQAQQQGPQQAQQQNQPAGSSTPGSGVSSSGDPISVATSGGTAGGGVGGSLGGGIVPTSNPGFNDGSGSTPTGGGGDGNTPAAAPTSEDDGNDGAPTAPTAPELTLPSTASVTEDGSTTVSGFSLTGSGTITTTVVASSTVEFASIAGLVFTQVDGAPVSTPPGPTDQFHSATFEGDAGDINNALNGLTYRPTADDDDGGAISITVTGENGGSATSVLAIGITPVNNDAPFVSGNVAGQSVDEGAAWSLTLPNDLFTDPDTAHQGNLTYTAELVVGGNPQALPGWMSFNGTTGVITGNPGFTDAGTHSVRITATDPTNQSTSMEFDLVVADANGAPTAVDDNFSVLADQIIGSADLTPGSPGQDSDPDTNDVLTVVAINGNYFTPGIPFGLPSGAQIAVVGNGGFTYYPPSTAAIDALPAGQSTTDSFTYTIEDPSGAESTATATITINGVNDAPDAAPDSTSTNEDTAVIIDVLANDTDPDIGATLTVGSIDGTAISSGQTLAVSDGTVTLNANGTLTFTPDADFSGQATFDYDVSDGTTNAIYPATVTVDVTPVADAPLGSSSGVSTGTEDSAISIPLNAVLVDTDGSETLDITLSGFPAGATFNLGVADGANWLIEDSHTLDLSTLTMTPPADFNGSFDLTVEATATETSGGDTATKTYTQTVTVTPVNDAPTILGLTSPGSVEVNENDAWDTSASYAAANNNSPTINDFYADDIITLDITLGVRPGFTFSLVAPGLGALAPFDSVLFSNNPTHFTSLVDSYTVTGTGDTTLFYNISNVNFGGNPGWIVDASVQSGGLNVTEDTAGTFSGLSITDPDIGAGTLDVDLTVTNGDLSLGVTTGLTQTDSDGTDGTLAFSGTLAEVNAALASLSYIGNVNYVGSDALAITVNDNGNTGTGGALTDTGQVVINVAAENDAPVGVADTGFTTDEDTPLTIDVLANDTDGDAGATLGVVEVDGQAISLGSPVTVADGTVALEADGRLTFTPTADFSGAASFTYLVNDGTDDAASVATVSVDVTPVADVPLGSSQGATPVPQGSDAFVHAISPELDADASIVALSGGGAAVVWKGDDGGGSLGIKARVLDNNGGSASPVIDVNTGTTGDQYQAAVGALTGGGFVVVWRDDSGADGDQGGVFAQRYDSAGNAQGSNFQVNTTTVDFQYAPYVLGTSDGGFVVSWTTSGADVDFQRFSAAGAAVGGEAQANSTVTNDQYGSHIAELSGGGFIISWVSQDQDGDQTGIFFQRYSAAWVPDGGEVQANETSAGAQTYPNVATLTGGGFVVTWTADTQDAGTSGVYGRIFNASGAATGGEFQINTHSPDVQENVFVQALSDGGFVAVWQSENQGGSTNADIYGQRFDANGGMVGSEFIVNSGVSGGDAMRASQIGDAITLLSSGELAVVWTDNSQSGGDIQVRLIDVGDLDTEDTAISVPLNAALSDIDGSETLGITLAAFPVGSTFNLGVAGPVNTWVIENAQAVDLTTLEMTPPADFNGSFSLNVTVTATEGVGGSFAPITYTQDVVVLPANDAPVGVDDTGSGLEDTLINIDVVTNDTDIDTGDTLSVVEIAGTAVNPGDSVAVAGGTVTLNAANGTLDFLPDANFTGDATFNYLVSDGTVNAAAPATVTVTVNPDNDAPTVDVSAVIDSTNLVTNGSFESGAVPGSNFTVGDTNVSGWDVVSGTVNFESAVSWQQIDGGISVDLDSDFTPGTLRTVLATKIGAIYEVKFFLSGNPLVPGDPEPVKDLRVSAAGESENFSFDTTGRSGLDMGWVEETFRFTASSTTTNLLFESREPNGSYLGPVIDGVRAFEVGAATTNEDTPITLSGLTVADVDGSAESLTVTLGVTNGTLDFTGGTDITALSGVSGQGTATLQFTGTQADINAALAASIDYTPTNNFAGEETLSIDVFDETVTTSDTVSIDVLPVADAPVVATVDPTPVPQGSDVMVNQLTAGDQGFGSVAALSDGNFVVSWISDGTGSSDQNLFIRVFDPSGNPLTGDSLVDPIASNTIGDFQSAVSGLTGGGFVVTWRGGVSPSDGIFAQRYANDGTPQGAEITVHTNVTGEQTNPYVLGTSDGGFIVTWTTPDSNGSGVVFQRFDAVGQKVGSETLVNTTEASDQSRPHVLELQSGGFVISWTDVALDGDSDGVFFQRFDASWSPQGGETQANTTTANSQSTPQATALEGGGFVVSWTSFLQDGSSAGVIGRVFDATGNPIGAEVQFNTFTTNIQDLGFVQSLPDGGFVAIWRSVSQSGPTSDIYGQRFDSSGSKVGSEFLVNSDVAGDQGINGVIIGDALTLLTNGQLVAVWEEGVPASDVEFRLIDIPGTGIGVEDTTIPTPLDITLADTDGSETLAVTLSGFPAGATFSHGAAGGVDPNIWEITSSGDIEDLANLTMTPPADFNGSFTLTITATATETLTGGAATTVETQTVVVAPVNDAPTLNAANTVETGAITEDDVTPISLSGAIEYDDVDESDDHTATVTGVTVGAGSETGGLTATPAQLQALLTLAQTTAATGAGVGTFSWTFAAAASVFAYLDAGQQVVLDYVVEVSDGNGGSIPQTISITVNGSAPLEANTVTASVAEGDEGILNISASGGGAPYRLLNIGDEITFQLESGNWVTFSESGATYLSVQNETGIDVFSYVVQDSTGAQAPGTMIAVVDQLSTASRTLNGTGNEDTLLGGAGIDVISGGAGDDWIWGVEPPLILQIIPALRPCQGTTMMIVSLRRAASFSWRAGSAMISCRVVTQATTTTLRASPMRTPGAAFQPISRKPRGLLQATHLLHSRSAMAWAALIRSLASTACATARAMTRSTSPQITPTAMATGSRSSFRVATML